jgi:hypothetical protein
MALSTMQETRHVNYLVLGNLFTNLFQVTLGEDQPHITLSTKNHQSSKDCYRQTEKVYYISPRENQTKLSHTDFSKKKFQDTTI